MNFGARELPDWVEHVANDSLGIGQVYFIVDYRDDDLLIPEVRAVVFVGRNMFEGDEGKVYFQDYESYRSQDTDKVKGETVGGSLDAFLEDQSSGVFDYERALEELMRCSVRRRKKADNV